jgi:hypothetical protein
MRFRRAFYNAFSISNAISFDVDASGKATLVK